MAKGKQPYIVNSLEIGEAIVMSSLCFWHVEHPEFLPLGLEHQIYFGRNQIVSEISFSNQFLETIPNGEYPFT